jgi:hypothetical protein
MPFISTLTPSAVLLGPVIGLNIWHFVMEGWMYHARITSINKNKTPVDNTLTKHDFDKRIPPESRWKADNYNHLFEQPTQFYAVALTLALLGAESKVDVGLAWGYVGLRVIHSIVQSVWNPILKRFGIYITMSGVLAVMTVRAALMLLERV